MVVEFNTSQQRGHFKWLCRSATNNSTKLKQSRRHEEENEPETIRHFTQINKIMPYNNDYYVFGIKRIVQKQNFIIDTASSVTIMPGNPTLYNTEVILSNC